MSESSRKEYNEDNEWRDEERLRILYGDDGLSLPEIGEKYDITHQAVLYWFDKHDIETRDTSDYDNERFENDYVPDGRTASPKQTIICRNCIEIFPVKDSLLGDRQFCSLKCFRAGYQKPPFERERIYCDECGAAVDTTEPDNRRYCSLDCYHIAIDEGKGTLNETFRKRECAAGWREAVFSRDEYTCQGCGERGGDLEAHHKTPVSEIVDEIEDKSGINAHPLFCVVENGVTLCTDCHEDTHVSK